jgi:hypothetical protein
MAAGASSSHGRPLRTDWVAMITPTTVTMVLGRAGFCLSVTSVFAGLHSAHRPSAVRKALAQTWSGSASGVVALCLGDVQTGGAPLLALVDDYRR